MKKLAICIPTYKRSDIIAELLDRYALIYKNYGFDLYIFDSSENNQTEMEVLKYKQKYTQVSDCVLYQHVDSSIHSNLKVYSIYEQFGLNKEYEYVWICSDSIRWSVRVLDAVKDAMCQRYDLIIPNYRDVEKIGKREYRNEKNALFLDCAWHMTLYGATILRCQTMLQNVDWEYLKQKYCIPECINHSHVAFYFEKITMLTEWKALHLGFERRDLLSTSRKVDPGWMNNTFYIWCYCWPMMINKLPACYDKEKKAVIKKQGTNDWLFTISNFIDLREKSIFNSKIFKQYRKQWKDFTDTPTWLIGVIAYFPQKNVKCLLNCDRKVMKYYKVLKRKIKAFCKNYDRIYIYGAGKQAKLWGEWCDKMGIAYENYVVSHIDERTPKSMRGHEIILFTDRLITDKTGFLLALNAWNTDEVLKDMKGKNVHYFNEFEVMEML